eukprot:9230577-Ditylum_brightwellii.AAC.1
MIQIDLRSLEFANHSVRNKLPPILFYIPEKKKSKSLLITMSTSCKQPQGQEVSRVLPYGEVIQCGNS